MRIKLIRINRGPMTMVAINDNKIARLLLLLVMLLPASQAAAVMETGGRFESGAYWRAQVPEGWRPGDGLVIWNHGFDLNPLEARPALGPLALLQLSQGYAVAATSYSQTGWALFGTLRDLRDLEAGFAERFGRPERVYLTGGSLGGLVSVQGAEAAGMENVAGVYSLCGALGGSRLWDAALDLRLAYDAVCDDVSGASIRGGAEGLPFRLDPDEYANEDLTTALGLLLGDRVNACTGVLESPADRTGAQQARLDRLMSLLDIPNERFFLLNMGYATFGLADLVHDPGKLDGAIGNGNRGVDYGEAGLNDSVARVSARALHRLRLQSSYTPTGDLGGVPMVAVHTSRDGLVPVGNLGDYAAKADPRLLTTAVAEESEPSHCGFSPAEAVAGWNTLRARVEEGAEQPAPADLQAECMDLESGPFDGPCRFAPGFDTGGLDRVARPRPSPAVAIHEGMSGAWFDPERAGEGWVIEVLEGGQALVYWFTYPPEHRAGEQRWLVGVGEVDGDTIRARLLEPIGRRFGSADSDVALTPWGEVSFHFSGPDAGVMRWAGPGGYSAGHHDIRRLAGPPHDPGGNGFAASGSWHDPAWDGEGWHLLRLDAHRVLVYWFTFDAEGSPAWLLGVGRMAHGEIVLDDATLPTGAAFGYAFDPDSIEMTGWGTLRFKLHGHGCRSGNMTYDSPLPAFGQGARSLERLTVLEDWCRH